MKTTPMKPFAALAVLSLLLFVAAEAAFVSPTSSSQVKVAATHLGAEQTRRDVFATAAASCFAAVVAASTPLPAYADVTNKVASAAALRGVKRGLKDLEKTEFYAAENNYYEGDDEGYFVEEVVEGAELLGRKSDDGQYHNVMVEEVTEAGCKVLFTAYDDGEEIRAELPREHLRIAYPYEEGDDDDDDEEEEGDEEGYFVAEAGIPVGAELLGRKSDDGQYYDCLLYTSPSPRD